MFLFLKKKPDAIDKPADSVAGNSFPTQDFIPYFCHYNPHTLITKNGELLQTIKIASNNRGLTYESGDGSHNTVRDNIRRAICETIRNDNFSLWIHTIRKRKPISFGATYKEPLAAYTHTKWQKKNRWKYQYYNEIYVTVLHDGQAAPLFDKHTLKDVLLPKRNRAYRNRYLDASYVELDRVVALMMQTIGQNYNVHRLSLAERLSTKTPGQTVFYSEPMEFLGTLINLHAEDFPVATADISAALCNHKITFGFNALESKSASGNRRFGALLTLKQYRELTPEAVDRVLQSPMELVIGQSFHFIPHKIALKQYREQKELFDISGDTYSGQASGLEEILRSNRKLPTDFGNQQTSIMVLVDEYKLLDAEVARAQEAFTALGLITVREDIKLEECFWAQLPGNFEFIRRADAISTDKVSGFCRLNLFPDGINIDNHWGEALSLIPTTVNAPYFFNFHHQDNGHTVMFDFNSFHDQAGNILLHFLLSSALKYQGKLFMFDRHRSSYLFFDKLEGHYHSFALKSDRQGTKPNLNPFSLEDSPRNKAFLLAWCLSLVERVLEPDNSHKESLQIALELLYAKPVGQRHLPGLVELIHAKDPQLAAAFSEFHGRGKLASWFDAVSENLDLSNAMQGFDMDEAVKQGIAVPVFSYLLHRIITEIDGKPTIIVLHEAWHLLENSFFAPRLESLMQMLTQNNVMVIFTTRNPQACLETRTLETVMKQCATHLYVPDDVAFDYESTALGINKHASRLLFKMDRQKGEFLLRQGQESIALRVNLDDMDDIRAIFANDIKNLIAAGGQFASLPQGY